jgi:putative thioredoxin
MNDSPHKIEANQNDFEEVAVKKSHEVPVLVDFWAPWCGPCKMLTPILTKLAEDYAGKFRLVTVNTDENPILSQDHGIRGIPTVKLFVEGKVVDQFVGVLPEGVIRELLGHYVERDSDQLRKQARPAARQGDYPQARQLLQQALASDPENQRIHPDLAQVLLTTGDLDGAEEVLKQLPDARQQDEDIARLLIRIKFARITADAPEEQELAQRIAADPNDSLARYRLSTRLVLREDFETALAHLIELLERDRGFQDDAARKAAIDIFTLLGGHGPLVKRYRTLLSTVLH